MQLKDNFIYKISRYISIDLSTFINLNGNLFYVLHPLNILLTYTTDAVDLN